MCKINIINMNDNNEESDYYEKDVNEDNEDIYDEKWAIKNYGDYSQVSVSEEMLLERKSRIDQIYSIYDDMKVLDPYTLHPDEWLCPPKYCSVDQLLNNLNGYREDLRIAYKTEYNNRKNKTTIMNASTSCSDLNSEMDLSAYVSKEIVDESPRIISIDGNIGSGKSTLYKKLQEYYSHRSDICFVPEPVDIWSTIKDDKDVPILTNLYKDTKKYAFRFQMMAYISRLNLLRKRLMERKHKLIISERCVQTDKNVFAQMLYDDKMIEHDEFIIYNRWFNEFLEDINMFGIIYVHASPETCHERVIKRGREGENIPLEYLQKCHKYHETWLSDLTHNNIHKIDADTNITETENVDVMKLWLTNIDAWIDKTMNKISDSVFYINANPVMEEDSLSISYNIQNGDNTIIHSNQRLFMKDRMRSEDGLTNYNYVEFNIDTGVYLSIIDGLRYITRGKDSSLLNIKNESKIIIRSKEKGVIDYINGAVPGAKQGIYKNFKNVILTSIIGYPNIEFTYEI
jgi:deoxyguanosine kinase